MTSMLHIRALEYVCDGKKQPLSSKPLSVEFNYEKKSFIVGGAKFKLDACEIQNDTNGKMKVKGDGIILVINPDAEFRSHFESAKKGIKPIATQPNENSRNFAAPPPSTVPRQGGSRSPLRPSSASSNADGGSSKSLHRAPMSVYNKTPVKSALGSRAALPGGNTLNGMMSGQKQGSASRQPPVMSDAVDDDVEEVRVASSIAYHVSSSGKQFKSGDRGNSQSRRINDDEHEAMEDIEDFDEVPYSNSRTPGSAVHKTPAPLVSAPVSTSAPAPVPAPTSSASAMRTYGKASTASVRESNQFSWADTDNDISFSSPKTKPKTPLSFGAKLAQAIPSELRNAQLQDLAKIGSEDNSKVSTAPRPLTTSSRAGQSKTSAPVRGNSTAGNVNKRSKVSNATKAPTNNLTNFLVHNTLGAYSAASNYRSSLFSQSLFRPSAVSVSSKGALEGLRNLGNTCYMNAVVQALIGLRVLTNDLGSVFWTTLYSQTRSTVAEASGAGANEIDRKSCFVQLVNIVNALSSSSHGVIDMRLMKAAVDAQSDRFLGSAQQDAHEFLIDLVSVLHDDMEARLKRFVFDTAQLNGISHLLVKEGSEKTDASEQPIDGTSAKSKSVSGQQPLRFPLSPQLLYLLPTVRHMHSCLTLQMQCTSCGLRKDPRQEFYRDFSLDFDFDTPLDSQGDASAVGSSKGVFGSYAQRQRVFQVEELLTRFFAAEDRDLQCDSCHTTGAQATVIAQISLLPRVLVLHLKRFKYNSASNTFQKVSNKVAFQKHLDLRQFCSDDCQATLGNEGGAEDGDLSQPCAAAIDLGEEVQRIRRLLDGAQPSMTDAADNDDEENTEIMEDDNDKIEFLEGENDDVQNVSAFQDISATPTRDAVVTSYEELMARDTPSPPPSRHSITSPSSGTVNSNSNCHSNSMKRVRASEEGVALDSLATRYTLSAVARHLGSDAFAGHYICDTLAPPSMAESSSGITESSNCQWRRCNDSHVTPISESEVLAEQDSPYILFYTRC